jgi:hypothetical protein
MTTKRQAPVAVAYLIIVLSLFMLAMSSARDTMNERVAQCWRNVDSWRNEAYSMVAVCAGYGESVRDLVSAGGGW